MMNGPDIISPKFDIVMCDMMIMGWEEELLICAVDAKLPSFSFMEVLDLTNNDRADAEGSPLPLRRGNYPHLGGATDGKGS